MKRKNNLFFIGGIIVMVVALMFVLAYISKSQTSKLSEGLPTAEDINKVQVENTKEFDLENQPQMGKDTAPIEVVQFGDYKCPACKQWEQFVFPTLKEEFIDKGIVKFYFMNFSFKGYDSYLASIAGEIIYEMNEESFWQYNDAIYKKQGLDSSLWANQAFLIKLVKENVTGIDQKEFENKLKNNYKDYIKYVKQDLVVGQLNGVTGTPSVFVNGEKLTSTDYESLKLLIESKMEEKVSEAKENLEGEK